MPEANYIAHTKEVINTVALKSDRVILFYSGGKDSIVLLDLIAPHFKEIICVFMYFVKDMEHINRFLSYSQSRYPNTRFIQVPHWNLTHLLRGGFYCKPQPSVPIMTLKDVVRNVKMKYGIQYAFLGMKQADSLNRRLMLRGYDNEAINEKSGSVYPLSKWKQADIMAYQQFHKLPKPIQYTNKKRSQGMGFDIDVFLFLQKNYPADLKKIFDQFPLAEQILFEHEHREHKREIQQV